MKKLSELICEVIRSQNTVNTCKSVLFLYTISVQLESKMFKNNYFQQLQKIRYLDINLIKHIQDQ